MCLCTKARDCKQLSLNSLTPSLNACYPACGVSKGRVPSKITFPIVPVFGALLFAGCVSAAKQKPLAVAPQAPVEPVVAVVAPAPATPDPIAILIAESDRHFEIGRNELTLGHLEQAKAEFDRALDAL